MPDTPLKMLDMASGHSARMFAQIDNAVTRNMNLQLQLQQQEAQTYFKAAQFGEQVRMNDRAIQESKENSMLRAMEYELESKIAPLKIQAETLNLKRAEFLLQRDIEQQERGMFNDLSAPVNEWAAQEFLRTGDMNALNEYTMLQARTMQGVGRGELEFDIDGYDKIVKNNIKFQEKTDHVYDPVTSRKLQAIDENSHKIYEHKYNPVYRAQEAGYASMFLLNGDPKVFGAFAALADGDSTAKLTSARSRVQSEQQWIDAMMNEYTKLGSLIPMAKSEEDANNLRVRQSEIYEKINEKSSIIERINSKVSSGDYDVTDIFTATVETVVPDRFPEANPANFSERRTETVSGLAPYSEDSLTGMVKNVEKLYAGVIPGYEEDTKSRLSLIDESVFADIDLSIYEDGSTRINSDEISKIQKQVLSNIREKKQKPSDARVMAIQPFVTSSVKIPLSRAAQRILYPQVDPMRTYGYTAPTKNYVVIGGSSDEGILEGISGITIRTNEDILELTKNIKSKEERELVRQEIYAAYHTAAIENTLK